MRTRCKICCITSRRELDLAVEAGADAIGLVSTMPSGPGVIPLELAADLAARTPVSVLSVLLTCETRATELLRQQRTVEAGALQLVGAVPVRELAALRRRRPGLRLIQVVHVTGRQALDRARAAGPWCDALLLDSGDPAAAVPELGGTGRVHDWEISRRIVVECEGAVYLAGGLRPENVGDAVDRVDPWGVDVCSGVRVDGALDRHRLAAFFRELRRADRRALEGVDADPPLQAPRGALPQR